MSQPAVAARLRAAGCVFAEEEARLLIEGARTPGDLDDMVERRVGGVPIEQVLGWAEFCGARLVVEPGVFVPRRRTEFLVAQAGTLVRQVTGRAVVVDLCCGVGALGAALATAADIELHAVDIEPGAVRCAHQNIPTSTGRVYQGDLYDPLPETLEGRVDVLVANVPYVPTGEIGLMPAEARLYEPPVALDGGADGLDVLRRVAAAAPRWLAPAGHLLFETSERQAAPAAEYVSRCGLDVRVVSSEELNATAVVARQRTG